MDDDALFAYAQRAIDVVEPIVRAMAIPYIKDEARKACSNGGAIGRQVVSDSVAVALDWYGMYHPTVYKRDMTLSNEGNIAVSIGDVETDGYTGSATVNVVNKSPHAGFSSGFEMRNGKFRPAGDVVARGRHYQANIKIPDDVMTSLWQSAVVQAYTSGLI